jgi:NAD(P)-dependent dehydrogenase (short-subunit alcohol dehydrogenase family)
MTDQRVALVTGAGTRLGYAIAEGLAADGFALALHYNSSADGAAALAREIEQKGAGELIGKAARALGGPVAVLVNSASAFDTDSLASLSAATWRKLTDVNVAAPVFLMQAFAGQEPTPEGGSIVNILDTQLTSASPERFSYFCGKFALDGATRLAAMALAGKGLRVNAVAPGLVLPSAQTAEEFAERQALTPLGAGLGPAHIVDAVRYLVLAEHVTGHTLVVDSGQRLMGFGNAPIG